MLDLRDDLRRETRVWCTVRWGRRRCRETLVCRAVPAQRTARAECASPASCTDQAGRIRLAGHVSRPGRGHRVRSIVRAARRVREHWTARIGCSVRILGETWVPCAVGIRRLARIDRTRLARRTSRRETRVRPEARWQTHADLSACGNSCLRREIFRSERVCHRTRWDARVRTSARRRKRVRLGTLQETRLDDTVPRMGGVCCWARRIGTGFARRVRCGRDVAA